MATPTSHFFLFCIILINGVRSVEYIDLTHNLGNDTMVYPGVPQFKQISIKKGYTEGGYWLEYNLLEMSEHTGTHMDAPVHFFRTGWTLDQIPVSHFIAPGVKIDIQDKVRDNPHAELTSDDLMAWLDEYGPLPDGVVVFVYTGWSNKYGNQTAYTGTDTNDVTKVKFPGINIAATQILTGYEAAIGPRVVGVGIDTLSVDRGESVDYPTHIELFKNNIYALENVANLGSLPATGFNVMVSPLKIVGGSGSPVRIIASLPGNNAAPAKEPMLPLLLAAWFAWALRCM